MPGAGIWFQPQEFHGSRDQSWGASRSAQPLSVCLPRSTRVVEASGFVVQLTPASWCGEPDHRVDLTWKPVYGYCNTDRRCFDSWSLHPFSPKRLERVRTVSLKQSNCQSLAWKWALAMCEPCQGREGGRRAMAGCLFSPHTVPNLFTFCSASYFPWSCLQDQCFNETSPNLLVLLSCGDSWVD